MDHAEDGDNDNVFVYMGGFVPLHLRDTITHIRIHKSVKIIQTFGAFLECGRLVSIEMHDGLEVIGQYAFRGCTSLRGIKLSGVRVIEERAFYECTALEDVEFGNKLETIGTTAFADTALRRIKLLKVMVIGDFAFANCQKLTEVELSEDLETIGYWAFSNCPSLRRIAMPLKDDLFGEGVFDQCGDLSQVDIIGGIHKTISSLLLDSWRSEVKNEIDHINQLLPNTDSFDKTAAIRRWMVTVMRRITHYKSEHYTLLKEFTTLLELALWKAKLDESQDERDLGRDQPAKKAKIDMKAARQEQRITSGANIVIKNVLPFLKLE